MTRNPVFLSRVGVILSNLGKEELGDGVAVGAILVRWRVACFVNPVGCEEGVEEGDGDL